MVRATRALVQRILGEAHDIRMTPAGGTLMKYHLKWACGCRAEQTGDEYRVEPCRRHYDDLANSA